MAKKDFGKGEKKGRLLASGRGCYSMMDQCYKNGWSDENTILVVMNSDDLESRWKIYEKKGAN